MEDTRLTKLTQDEAAIYLGVKKTRLSNWRSEGKGPAFYKPTGKLIYYFKEDLDKWIKGNE